MIFTCQSTPLTSKNMWYRLENIRSGQQVGQAMVSKSIVDKAGNYSCSVRSEKHKTRQNYMEQGKNNIFSSGLLDYEVKG